MPQIHRLINFKSTSNYVYILNRHKKSTSTKSVNLWLYFHNPDELRYRDFVQLTDFGSPPVGGFQNLSFTKKAGQQPGQILWGMVLKLKKSSESNNFLNFIQRF